MLSVSRGPVLGWGTDSAGGWVLVLAQWWEPILVKPLQHLLTSSKCLGRLTSEVQSTHDAERCWNREYELTPRTLTDSYFREICICLH